MYKIPAITLFLGKNLIYMPECHSTNDLALDLCQKPFTPEGTVVVTSHQTAGRGQRGNTWITEPGRNLTFSCVFKPTFLNVSEQFCLNMCVSLAVRDYLTEVTQAKVHIKWPNDILVDEKKICGILIENQITGNRLTNTVVGIGCNINQESFSIGTATSLMKITGHVYDLPSCLEQLLLKLEARYLQLRQASRRAITTEYLEGMYRYLELSSFETGATRIEGRIVGVDETGRLQVNVDGDINSFNFQEIRFVI